MGKVLWLQLDKHRVLFPMFVSKHTKETDTISFKHGIGRDFMEKLPHGIPQATVLLGDPQSWLAARLSTPEKGGGLP